LLEYEDSSEKSSIGAGKRDGACENYKRKLARRKRPRSIAFRAAVRKKNLCKMMREYIGERERGLDNTTAEPELREKALEWIAWAKQYVERIDPLKKAFEIRHARESEPSWSVEDADQDA
jgi:hypothetical protein